MGFERAGLHLGMSCRVGYGYWVRGSLQWAVRASKKSARAISTPESNEQRIFFSSFLSSCHENATEALCKGRIQTRLGVARASN